MNLCSWQEVLCSWSPLDVQAQQSTFHCLFEEKMLIVHQNGDNHIQNFHLGRYIVGYTFGNHVLRLRLRVAVKLNFRPFTRRYTSPNENFEYSYPLSGLSILLHGVISPRTLRHMMNKYKSLRNINANVGPNIDSCGTPNLIFSSIVILFSLSIY